jgi:hypothetical protein
VHLRRALLLFAIVLGLAAIAASVSRPPDDSPERAARPAPPPATEREETPTIAPGSATPAEPTKELMFDAEREQDRRLDVGQPATVVVEVGEAGLVEIPQLGVSAPAEPLTPARFEVLVHEARTLMIVFTPVEDDTPRPAGVLVVDEPRR